MTPYSTSQSSSPTLDLPALQADPKSSPQARSTTRNPLYKTELCRQYAMGQICRYGLKCQFAHGEHEIRPVQLHPHFKTKICRNYQNSGNCPYGIHCNFLHGKDDPLRDVAMYESVRELILGAKQAQNHLERAVDSVESDGITSTCSSDDAKYASSSSPLPQFSWIAPFAKSKAA